MRDSFRWEIKSFSTGEFCAFLLLYFFLFNANATLVSTWHYYDNKCMWLIFHVLFFVRLQADKVWRQMKLFQWIMRLISFALMFFVWEFLKDGCGLIEKKCANPFLWCNKISKTVVNQFSFFFFFILISIYRYIELKWRRHWTYNTWIGRFHFEFESINKQF